MNSSDGEGGVQAAGAEAAQSEAQALAYLAEHLRRPTTIHSIQVHGAKNTRQGFLDPLVKPLIGKDNVGTTMGDVLRRLRGLSEKLDRLGCFKPEPEIIILGAQPTSPDSTATDIDVAVRLREQGRFMLKTGTDFGNTEGSAYGNLLWRNIFGGAENLSLNASAGTRTRSAYSAVLSTPVNSDPDRHLSLEVLASATQKPWASHEEVVKGAKLQYAWMSPSQDTHRVSYAGQWRQVTGLAANASPTVRMDAGDSVKSAFSHVWTRDRRDNPRMPQNGYLLRTISELAGWGPLGGDVAHSKSEMEISGAMPLLVPGLRPDPRVSIGGGFRFGMLWPLPLGWSYSGDALPSRSNDRFQLGGPTDVRGFKIGGLGPREGPDALGGDMFAASSVNLLLPLPRTPVDSNLRFQIFANAGRLVGLRTPRKEKNGEQVSDMSPRAVMSGLASSFGQLANGLPSTAAGFGIVYAHPVARFELNFSLPLVLRRGEEGRKGLQVGVGLDFL